MKMKMTVLALAVAISPQLRATIHRAFRPDDFEVVWTATPSEAAEASNACHPGLVVLDLDPSARADNAILEDLRTLNPGTPMVVLAEDLPVSGDGKSVADSGVVVLRKPVGTADLADTARALLGASTSSGGREGKGPNISLATENAENFREMMRARHDTPFKYTPCNRFWGINE